MHTYKKVGKFYKVVFMVGQDVLEALPVKEFTGDTAEQDAASYVNFLNGGAGGNWHGFRNLKN